MDNHRRPHLLSLSTPARPVSTSPTEHTPSQSPFRYVHFPEPELSEKSGHDIALQRSPPSSSSSSSASTARPLRSSAPPSPAHYNSRSSSPSPAFSRPRGLRIAERLRPWIPLIIYGLSSLILVVAIAFFKTQVFTFLDDLSVWLRADEHFGFAVLYGLIFITTFPPVPMYSTLIILSGYTFGPWIGATISYLAALSGALTVFLISRTLLRESISRWLESACTVKRVVRAVEKRPKLLFLVRLAPYPYNVMNCLLAASPSLTLRTYTLCTAASLFKVIIHTSLGASIHSFKNYHTAPAESDAKEDAGDEPVVARIWAIAGVVLCIAIFVYISWVARRAVDEELDNDECDDSEETAAFLPRNANADDLEAGRPMVELRR